LNYQRGIKVLTVVLIILAALTVVALYFVYTVGAVRSNPLKPFAETEVAETDPGHINFNTNSDLRGQAVTINGQKYYPKQNVVNILLLGIDADTTQKGRSGWRSDMIMLCTVDFDTNNVSLLSIPRDTKTTVYHVDDNGKVSSEETNKLNAAYAFGGGPKKYSAENSMRCVRELLECDGQLSVPIDYYVSVDLEGLPKIADALDGVEVTLDQNFPGLGSKGEVVDLNGSNVRKYLENRHDMDDGEYSRQKHERDFIMGMMRKIKDMGAVKAAPKLFTTFLEFMNTNLQLDQVLSLATVMDNTQLDAITFEGLTEGDGGMDGSTWYYHVNEAELLGKMLGRMYTPAS